MEAMGRLFLCARCRVQVLICSACDHGQVYCAGGCSQLTRRASVREAGQRYQRSRKGRFVHAERSRRYRERRQNVTHQGSLSPKFFGFSRRSWVIFRGNKPDSDEF